MCKSSVTDGVTSAACADKPVVATPVDASGNAGGTDAGTVGAPGQTKWAFACDEYSNSGDPCTTCTNYKCYPQIMKCWDSSALKCDPWHDCVDACNCSSECITYCNATAMGKADCQSCLDTLALCQKSVCSAECK